MRFKKYYKDIISLIASLSLLGTVYFVNHYDIKQLYREFVGLRLKVQSQEKTIGDLKNEIKQYRDLYSSLQSELETHNEERGKENALLSKELEDLKYKVEVLSMKSTLSSNISGNDRFEFTDKQVNRVGQYETKGQVLVAWKDDYLTTKKVNVNTIGEINLSPKIEKLSKKEFISYIDETYIGGITIRGRGEIQQIEPPRNQFSFGPFIGVAYNNSTGLTEPIIGIGISYNLLKVWDWR